MLIALKKIL